MDYNPQQLLSKIAETRMIPVFSHDDEEVAWSVLQACYQGGVRVFEFTDRTEKAFDVFCKLRAKVDQLPGLVLGVGTIMDKADCVRYHEAGAQFIVAPIVDAEVANYCSEKQISWTPGCGTLTELITAVRLGAGLIKVFPADVLGPKFIKGVLGPCPQLKLMPTGGVTPDPVNLEAWFRAGVTCVGMGSQLFSKQLIAAGQFEELSELVADTLSTIHQLTT